MKNGKLQIGIVGAVANFSSQGSEPGSLEAIYRAHDTGRTIEF